MTGEEAVETRQGPDLHDFPDWAPPLLVRESRRLFRRRGPILLFLLLHGFFALVLTAEFAASATIGDDALSVRPLAAVVGAGILLTGATALFAWILPLSHFRSLRAEASNPRELEVALLHLSPDRFVVGRWLASVVLIALLGISLLPYCFALPFTGTVGAPEIASRVVSAAILCLSHTAVVLGCSVIRGRIARIAATGWLLLLLTLTSLAIRSEWSAADGGGWIVELGFAVRYLLCHAVGAWFGLLVGASGLRCLTHSTLANPGIFLAIAWLLPLLQAAGARMGGSVGSIAGMTILLAATIALRHDSGRKNRLPQRGG